MESSISSTVTNRDPRGVVVTLRAELERLVAEADAQPALAALLDGTADRDLYVRFLVETRHYVNRTYPTLTAAGARLRQLGRHPVLADLFEQKVEEEVDHDILIDNDLRVLGVDPAQALASGPCRWIAAYNAWIKAVADGEHPAGFLGSAYVLEGLAVRRAGHVARGLKAANRIPGIADAVTFLDLHAEADIGHVDDLDRILASLEDTGECEAIAMTAGLTRVACVGMLDEINPAGVGMRIAA